MASEPRERKTVIKIPDGLPLTRSEWPVRFDPENPQTVEESLLAHVVRTRELLCVVIDPKAREVRLKSPSTIPDLSNLL
ncbi:MAG TPA: hypothetical protein VMW29_01620 [Candidatus Bathyarchaeia archaeon]|nr:hypothetical protein [Candidatus Bathyarchaeia archaeon]